MNNRFIKGQTALILILLTAAALIFLAITLNWGRIAQEKSMLTIAADESAAMLASNAASYGEQLKQTYLGNTNSVTSAGGLLMAIIGIIIAIAIIVIFHVPIGLNLAWAGLAMAGITLGLQAVVIQPGITSMWNKLQQNQPIEQQFFESGVSTALQGAVSDAVSISDYFDWNANGVVGDSNNKDQVSRFAVFYTERLKMLNKSIPVNPQVQFFYDQLEEFVDGENCTQNENDSKNNPGLPVNAYCKTIPVDCTINQTDTRCLVKIPNNFQLSDQCSSLSANPNYPNIYNPYCDPCCQPLTVPNPGGKPDPKPVRPVNCVAVPTPAICATNPTDPSCDPDVLPQCQMNNPFGPAYPNIYDASYQNYADQVSFLAQFGRDQQSGPFSKAISPLGNTVTGYFPNGIYPFFWKMNYYSPQVDNITPATLTASQLHWCTHSSSTAAAGYNPSAQLTTVFPDLFQLGSTTPIPFGSTYTPFALPYACSGDDCCVNFLRDTVVDSNSGQSNTLNITVGNGGFSIQLTNPTGPMNITPNSLQSFSAHAQDASGKITNLAFQINGQVLGPSKNTSQIDSPVLPASSTNASQISEFAACTGPNDNPPNQLVPASTWTGSLVAVAQDEYNNVVSSPAVNVVFSNPNAGCSGHNCGTDVCGNNCGACQSGQYCTLVPGGGGPGNCCLDCQNWNGTSCVSKTTCGSTCGFDSCGNPCSGTCPVAGQTCTAGVCK